MPIPSPSVLAATSLAILLTVFLVRHSRFIWSQEPQKETEDNDIFERSPEDIELTELLLLALPEIIIVPQHTNAFKQSMKAYWAQQECEAVPGCVIRPRYVHELSKAVTVLKSVFDERASQTITSAHKGLFAIRSGGHSPVPGAASIKGGALVDLSLLCSVTLSPTGDAVTIGAGAKWMDVSRVLDKKSLAVVGGKNSAVGVGGLTLGGGLSFFSPRYGMVCSNILSYEVVVASGSMIAASATSNPDLWRALKGGSNNFGIVTSFTARTFPCTQIWSGFLYMPAFQAAKVLQTFHACVSKKGEEEDTNASSIICFSYISQIRIQAISVNLVYTQSPEDNRYWPSYWRNSAFKPMWRFWSTVKIRTLTSATDEMNALNPPGRRQLFATTTIKNDLITLQAVYAAYEDAIASLRKVPIKGLLFTLVLQPLKPEWARKGDPNPLGLEDCEDALVIVSFTINWDLVRDDKFVKETTKRAIEQMDAVAAAQGTGHRYRYLNYCAEWQKPFEGYGEENRKFLREVSQKYDPDGTFQRGCRGGFKLGI